MTITEKFDTFAVTEFAGPVTDTLDFGCRHRIQITTDDAKFVQLNIVEAGQLVNFLSEWLRKHEERHS